MQPGHETANPAGSRMLSPVLTCQSWDPVYFPVLGPCVPAWPALYCASPHTSLLFPAPLSSHPHAFPPIFSLTPFHPALCPAPPSNPSSLPRPLPPLPPGSCGLCCLPAHLGQRLPCVRPGAGAGCTPAVIQLDPQDSAAPAPHVVHHGR